MSEALTVDDFKPRVGEPFAIVADGADGLALELVEARGLGHAYADREAFSLRFQGPVNPLLPQATYRLANARLGEVDIFIVPRRPQSAERDGLRGDLHLIASCQDAISR